MAPFSLPAPAKLNLFLHINGRRPDGYHLLQTLFVLLDHGDTLDFAPADTLSLRCDNPALPVNDDNLVLRAARLLQQETGHAAGARLHLREAARRRRRGSGSSDAATALWGLNLLWGLDLDVDTLARLGLSLGADVPVFVRGRNAWAEGVGERLQAVNCRHSGFWWSIQGLRFNRSNFRRRELTRHTPPLHYRPRLGRPLSRPS